MTVTQDTANSRVMHVVGPGKLWIVGNTSDVGAAELAYSDAVDAAGETRPNAAIMPLGAGGKVSFYTQSGAHLPADASGYFLG